MTSPVSLGSALRDEEGEERAALERNEGERRAAATAVHDASNLCGRCLSQPVCAVAAAVRLVGGEGQITISNCSAFLELPSGYDVTPAG